jgi:hypothetical protein
VALDAIGADTSSGYLFRAITRYGRLYKHQRVSEKTINNIVQWPQDCLMPTVRSVLRLHADR